VAIAIIGVVIVKNKELLIFIGLNDHSIKGTPAIITGLFLIVFGILGFIRFLQ
jgi:hypothetical protein